MLCTCTCACACAAQRYYDDGGDGNLGTVWECGGMPVYIYTSRANQGSSCIDNGKDCFVMVVGS